MDKIVTRIFIGASLVFGVTGVILALFGEQNDDAPLNRVLIKIIMVCVFIILPSFAYLVASKYLSSKH